jgi:hypothetical protein
MHGAAGVMASLASGADGVRRRLAGSVSDWGSVTFSEFLRPRCLASCQLLESRESERQS